MEDICIIAVPGDQRAVFGKHASRQRRAVSIISRFALPCAILVHSVTAWIFGLQIAKEGWYSAIMAPIFVASAMDSGLALLLCVLAALREALFPIDTSHPSLWHRWLGLLATCIAIDAFFIFCEVLTMAYPGAAGAETRWLMTSGPTAPFFWFEIVGGLAIPFAVLVFTKNRERTGLVVGASVLVIVGVLCKRLWLLFTSFIVPNMEGAPGIMSDGGWALLGSYAPTLPEVLIVLGVVSVGALGFMALCSKLLVPATETERAAARAAVGGRGRWRFRAADRKVRFPAGARSLICTGRGYLRISGHLHDWLDLPRLLAPYQVAASAASRDFRHSRCQNHRAI